MLEECYAIYFGASMGMIMLGLGSISTLSWVWLPHHKYIHGFGHVLHVPRGQAQQLGGGT